MSRVPLRYFSRGQLESFDWPAPVAESAARISNGDVKSAAATIRYLRKERLSNLIARVRLELNDGVVGTRGYRTLGQYGKSVFSAKGRWVFNAWVGPARSFSLKRKNRLPIIFHADDSPAILLRLVIKGLRERADFRVRQSLSGAVGVLPLGIIV